MLHHYIRLISLNLIDKLIQLITYRNRNHRHLFVETYIYRLGDILIMMRSYSKDLHAETAEQSCFLCNSNDSSSDHDSLIPYLRKDIGKFLIEPCFLIVTQLIRFLFLSEECRYLLKPFPCCLSSQRHSLDNVRDTVFLLKIFQDIIVMYITHTYVKRRLRYHPELVTIGVFRIDPNIDIKCIEQSRNLRFVIRSY